MNGTADIMREQIRLHKKLEDLEDQRKNMKEITLEAFEVIAGFLAWYHENINELDGLSLGSAMQLHGIVLMAKEVAAKAVVM